MSFAVDPREHRDACGNICTHVKECETCKGMLFPPCGQHWSAKGIGLDWATPRDKAELEWPTPAVVP